LHRNAPFPPQEMNTIEQARRMLDRAFTATIAKIAALQFNQERAAYEMSKWQSLRYLLS
jgi:hypothetical protein